MPSCDTLLDRARRAPQNMRFTNLCELAECYSFKLRRTRGSHFIYKRDGYHTLMNFQDDNGKAKTYQVKQLLSAIDEILSTQESEGKTHE